MKIQRKIEVVLLCTLMSGIILLQAQTPRQQESPRPQELPIPPADPSRPIKTISRPYPLPGEVFSDKKNDHKTSSRKSEFRGPHYAANLSLEKLGRGFVAIAREDGGISLSWRLLKDDPQEISFNLYRIEPDSTSLKLNKTPLTNNCYFIDNQMNKEATPRYVLESVSPKKKQRELTYAQPLSAHPYISIPLPQIEGDTAWKYRPNDASVGDLDGDGEYEIVLKRQVGNYACSQTGISGGTNHLEAYRLSGEQLWSIDIGVNVREGAQYFNFIVYDFDGDGKAEVICKTSEGTTFPDGKTIGDVNGDGITDYVIRDESRSRVYGKIDECPEFISVLEGFTGRELARGEYILRGCSWDWGDDNWNRSDRQLMAVAYLDGKHPSFVVGRGYNGRSVVEAWDFLKGNLTKRWRFDTHNGQTAASFKTQPLEESQLPFLTFSNQGNHQLRIGDVDGDGKDEIIYGACVLDNDGKGLYSTGWGHGDALHLTDIDIDRPGLEIWQCHEYAPTPYGSTLRDAATGEVLVHYFSTKDVGRAMCADIDPRYRGCEIWSLNSGGVRSCKGELISETLPSVNMAVWWDGDLSRELLDKNYIEKWTGNGTQRLFDGSGKGLTWNNGTKGSPCLQADIFGDWREEVIWPTQDGREIRVYMTEFPTEYRMTTFLQDPIYRMSVAIEMVGYNQPTATGFYVGTDSILVSAKPFF